MDNPRAEAFPYGLRVLVVDDDPTWLKILEKMLKKCSYEVTTCCLARVALDMLRERKDKFDIVISDVNMPDMDGFKLLEHVGLEMDLPVIMMSVDGETSRVMKGVQHGACDYLLKPVRMKELRNIWQHVYRKKIHEVKEIEGHDNNDDIQILRSRSEEFDERQLFSGAELNSVRKRKDLDDKEHAEQEFSDPSACKKARVVWSVDLHQKFVNAVNQIGFDKVGPKKILDLMNVPGLTRENVASHLQKYRLYLSRLQKQNEAKTSSTNLQPDLFSKDHPESFGFQSSIAMQQNSIASRYVCTTQKIQAQGIFPDIQVDDLKSIVSLQVTDARKAVRSDATDPQKVNSVSQLGVVVSFKGVMPNVDCKPFETSRLKQQQPMSSSIPLMQVMQNPKSNLESSFLFDGYSSLSQPNEEHKGFDHLCSAPSLISINCNTEREKKGISHIKPVSMDYRNSCIKTMAPMTCMIDSVSVQVERGIVNTQELTAATGITAPPRMNDLYYDQGSDCSLLSTSLDLGSKCGADSVSFPEDLQLYSVQGYGCFDRIFEYNDSTSVTEVHSKLCDEVEFDLEHLYDSMDPLLDGCLFA